MKKVKLFLMTGMLLLAMTSCGTEEKGPVSIEDIASQNMEEDASGENSTLEIEDQTFSVTLEEWGEVTFASFLPKENENGDGDVQFKLLKNGEVIYEFPGFNEENIRFNQQFGQVVAVAFKDYNDDGRTDVIIICEYAPISGVNMDESYREVRIYLQQEDSKEFVMDTLAGEFLTKQHYTDSIDSVLAAKGEYQDYVASLDGSRSVAAQMEIIARNKESWFENPEYMDEVYQCAVTDLDRNGRYEIIVSSFGGTGSYTYSRFFEVNESYDGLTECTTNFQEGDSQADIMVENTSVYYDAEEQVYHYIFSDYLHVGTWENYENLRALTLKDGQITEQYLAAMSEIADNSTSALESGVKGATVTFKDRNGNVIDGSAYYAMPDTVFAGMKKYQAAFGWQDMRELVGLSDAELAEKLAESRDEFIIANYN